MRITVELPDELMRRIKVHAALTDRKLNEVVPALLELGLGIDEGGAKRTPAPRKSVRGSSGRAVAPRTASRAR
jgi:hypothetical protein